MKGHISWPEYYQSMSNHNLIKDLQIQTEMTLRESIGCTQVCKGEWQSRVEECNIHSMINLIHLKRRNLIEAELLRRLK